MLYQNSDVVKGLKAQARQLGIPLYGAFELTGRCNFDCKMCYVHVLNAAEAKKKELSTEQWLSIMDDAYQAGMLFALLTGGECLIRPDFKDLYLHLYNKGVIMSVNTNGALINEDMAQFLGAHKPEWVQISLYGCGDDGYERVTGVRSFERVAKGIELLRAQNILVRIAITPSRQLMPDFEGILHYIQENKLPYRINDDLIPPREGVEREQDYALNFEERLDVLRRKAVLSGKPPIPVAPKSLPKIGGACETCETGMPCNAGTIRFVISWEGKMVPCMAIPEISAEPMRNGFDTAWQEIRAQMQKAVTPKECIGCAYEKKCAFCPAIRYDGLFSGRCRPEVCDFTVAKCAAGLVSLSPEE